MTIGVRNEESILGARCIALLAVVFRSPTKAIGPGLRFPAFF